MVVAAPRRLAAVRRDEHPDLHRTRQGRYCTMDGIGRMPPDIGKM
jgi:hypothetical protein